MKEINTILSIFFVIALIVIIIRVKNYLKELQEKNKIYPTIKDKEYLYFERKKLKAKYTRRVKK